MHSLKAVFNEMQSRDHVKVAQVRASRGLPPAPPDLSQVDPALLKQAQEYDQVGRILAHHVFADMVKQAVEEAMPDSSDADKKSAFDEAMESAMSGKKKDKKEGSDDESDDEYEESKPDKDDDDEDEKDKKSDDAGEKKAGAMPPGMKGMKGKGFKAKKKKILAKMAADPAYMSRLVAKHFRR